jgi:hypothetical protein
VSGGVGGNWFRLDSVYTREGISNWFRLDSVYTREGISNWFRLDSVYTREGISNWFRLVQRRSNSIHSDCGGVGVPVGGVDGTCTCRRYWNTAAGSNVGGGGPC